MTDMNEFSAAQSPYTERTAADYENTCNDCELLVEAPTVELKHKIVALLVYDKTSGGYRGRALDGDVPELSLFTGDRLAPNHFMRDVGLLEDLLVPFRVLFWRPSYVTFVTFRSPLFSLSSHLTIKYLSLDTLHALHLGAYKAYCCSVLWALLLADIYQTASTSKSDSLEQGLLTMRANLFKWYKK